MTTIKEFIQTKALEDRLPFGIDFDIEVDFNSDYPTEKIDQFELPKLDGLLEREAWFFEWLATANNNRHLDLQIEITLLAQELKDILGLNSSQEALNTITKPSPEITINPLYDDFLVHNAARFAKLGELNKLITSDRIINWLKVSFFMLSRYDSNWTMGKTAKLRTNVMEKLLKFINKEIHNGVEPPETQTPTQILDNQDLGKLPEDSKKAS